MVRAERGEVEVGEVAGRASCASMKIPEFARLQENYVVTTHRTETTLFGLQFYSFYEKNKAKLKSKHNQLFLVLSISSIFFQKFIANSHSTKYENLQLQTFLAGLSSLCSAGLEAS